jgi:hypothetical protein
MKLIDDRVKLLIERMEAFPDEFTTGVSKWDSLMSRGVQFLNPLERLLLYKKWRKIQREAALHRVVSILTEPTRDEIEREIVKKARLKIQTP